MLKRTVVGSMAMLLLAPDAFGGVWGTNHVRSTRGSTKDRKSRWSDQSPSPTIAGRRAAAHDVLTEVLPNIEPKLMEVMPNVEPLPINLKEAPFNRTEVMSDSDKAYAVDENGTVFAMILPEENFTIPFSDENVTRGYRMTTENTDNEKFTVDSNTSYAVEVPPGSYDVQYNNTVTALATGSVESMPPSPSQTTDAPTPTSRPPVPSSLSPSPSAAESRSQTSSQSPSVFTSSTGSHSSSAAPSSLPSMIPSALLSTFTNTIADCVGKDEKCDFYMSFQDIENVEKEALCSHVTTGSNGGLSALLCPANADECSDLDMSGESCFHGCVQFTKYCNNNCKEPSRMTPGTPDSEYPSSSPTMTLTSVPFLMPTVQPSNMPSNSASLTPSTTSISLSPTTSNPTRGEYACDCITGLPLDLFTSNDLPFMQAVLASNFRGSGHGRKLGCLCRTEAPSASAAPSLSPSHAPSRSFAPSTYPSSAPTLSMLPSSKPSSSPSTSQSPSADPTTAPSSSLYPSPLPSSNPTHSTSPSSAPSSYPSTSAVPSDIPSTTPTLSSKPSRMPSSAPTRSSRPTKVPSLAPTASIYPSSEPSSSPSISQSPSVDPTNAPSSSLHPSSSPSFNPTHSTSPSSTPSSYPSWSALPSTAPSATPTLSHKPSSSPSLAPTRSSSPTEVPSVSPTLSLSPSVTPTTSMAPTFYCGDMSPDERERQLRAILRTVSDENQFDNLASPQGKAFDWIVNQDPLHICPGTDCQVVQRFALATLYYSTEGENWFYCNADPATECPEHQPTFTRVNHDWGCDAFSTRWLTDSHECDWCGNRCNTDRCMTQIQMEINNQAGKLPNELAAMTNLTSIRMEQGNITGTIPETIGGLEQLLVLDFDYQDLSGSIPEQLYTLENLIQLDLNDNKFTGTISSEIGNLQNLVFLQLQNNQVEGGIPSQLGKLNHLYTAEFFGNDFKGTMPEEVCNLGWAGAETWSNETLLSADCLNDTPVTCPCCTMCH